MKIRAKTFKVFIQGLYLLFLPLSYSWILAVDYVSYGWNMLFFFFQMMFAVIIHSSREILSTKPMGKNREKKKELILKYLLYKEIFYQFRISQVSFREDLGRFVVDEHGFVKCGDQLVVFFDAGGKHLFIHRRFEVADILNKMLINYFNFTCRLVIYYDEEHPN